jgi:hypothetical protein
VKTEELIVNLARASGPWTPLSPIRVRVIRWLLVSLGLCALTVMLIGARGDLARSLQDPAFLFFAIATLAAGLVAAAAAMTLSVPGAEVTPIWRILAVLLVTGWAVAWAAALVSGGDPGSRLAAFPNHWACVAEIVGLSVVSGWVFFAMLRRAAPLRRAWCAALAALASAALAATATQLICPIDDPAHHVVSHVAPVALLTGLGTLAGSRTLRRPARHAGR